MRQREKTFRHAVVTGTSSGIGQAIAQRLLDDGWRVTGFDLTPASIHAAAFHAVSVDLTDAKARLDAIDATSDVTALVHAAGIMRGGRLGSLDLSASDLLWRVHVDAAIALADRVAPRLIEGGRILLIGSRAARGVANRSQYGATKAALVGLARSWAKELAPRGITVNVVAPAATDTAMLADPERSTVAPATPPIGRLIRPGQEIAICGGASL